MLYRCKRCGFSSHIKTHYIRHLETRKKPCKVKYLDIPIETLIKELDDKNCKYAINTPESTLGGADMLSNKKDTINSFECEYCKKIFKEKR